MKKLELKIGKHYKCYDNGIKTPSREYDVTLLKKKPFEDFNEITKTYIRETIKIYAHLYPEKDPDLVLIASSNEHESYDICLFVQTIDKRWFGVGCPRFDSDGDIFDNCYNSGELWLYDEFPYKKTIETKDHFEFFKQSKIE